MLNKVIIIVAIIVVILGIKLSDELSDFLFILSIVTAGLTLLNIISFSIGALILMVLGLMITIFS